jgi:hypothetical protein
MKKIQLLLILSVLFIDVQASFAQHNEIIPHAPASVKIDGKLTEFADSLTNYDKTTKVYYAIAHDANNLYVFIKANGQQEQSKIMAGGISVSVNNKGKKKESSTVTFPVVDRTAMMSAMRSGRGEQGNRSSSSSAASTERTPEERAAQRTEMRKKMISQFKEIKVSGLNGISVESISIYNTYGIKTGINYDDKNALVYELAIPLNLVNIDLESAEEIAINIRLNGIELPETGSSGGGFGGGEGRSSGGFGGGGFGGGNFGGGRTGGEAGSSNRVALFTPTEFWVKAKLAQ